MTALERIRRTGTQHKHIMLKLDKNEGDTKQVAQIRGFDEVMSSPLILNVT